MPPSRSMRPAIPLTHRDIRRMFSSLVPWYDFLNRLLTLRRDVYWRRRLVEGLPPWPSPTLLDLAAGTLDVALELARRYPKAQVVAADFSHAMLCHGRQKWLHRPGTAPLILTTADAFRLPFREAVFQAVTLAFGIRNMPPRGAALAEMHRVLRPDGWLAVLEFGPPAVQGLSRLYNLYLTRLVPYLGKLLSHHTYAYQYLAASIQDFPPPPAFVAELRQAGFQPFTPLPLTGGIAWLFFALKSSPNTNRQAIDIKKLVA